MLSVVPKMTRTADLLAQYAAEFARRGGKARAKNLTAERRRVIAPIITDIVDEALFADLRGLGLDDSDAKHLMYAVTNACDRFVTLDPDFLNRRAALEARCPSIRILRPAGLAAELQLDPTR